MLVSVGGWGGLTTAPQPSNAAALLAGACRSITDYCGWGIEHEVVTDQVLDSPGGQILRLPTLHLTAVDEVLVDGTAITDFTWSATGMLWREAGWPIGFRRVTWSGAHGYTPVPENLQMLAVGLALRSALPVGLQSEKVGGEDRTFRDDVAELSSLDKLALDAYRLEPS